MAMRKPRTNSRLTAKSSQQQGVSERDEDAGERGGKPRVSSVPIAVNSAVVIYWREFSCSFLS